MPTSDALSQTPVTESGVQHAWHLYVLRLELDRLRIDRNRFIVELNDAGIGTSVHYMPLHMHPYYRDVFGYQPHDLPAARSVYERIVSLPIYPGLGDSEIDYVIETVTRIVKEHRR